MISVGAHKNQSFLLDLTRYFLASIVVLGHGFGLFLGYFDGFFPEVFPHPQSIAVVCFFFLSGYLIVGSQVRKVSNGVSSLRQYLFDRTARVYITLVPSLVFVALVDCVFHNRLQIKTDFSENLGAIVFIKNLLLIPSVPFGTMRPVWSLMYEWWIYLLFAGVFFVGSNRALGLVLSLAGLYCVMRMGFNGDVGHIWIIWSLGGVCAYVRPSAFWAYCSRRSLIVISLLLLFGAGYIYFRTKDAYNLSAGVLLSIFMFISVCGNVELQVSSKVVRVVRGLAGFSFTLFLTHYTVLFYAKKYFELDGWVGLVVGFFVSNLIAYIIAFFTEYKIESFKLKLGRLMSLRLGRI